MLCLFVSVFSLCLPCYALCFVGFFFGLYFFACFHTLFFSFIVKKKKKKKKEGRHRTMTFAASIACARVG